MFTKDYGPLWRRMMVVLERAGKFNKLPPVPELKAMVLEYYVLQLKLAQVEVVANHGNGLVKAIATCDGKLSRVELSGRAKELPREGLQEVVTAAVNDSIEKARLRQRKADEVLMDKHVPALIELAKTVFMADPELRAASLRLENLESEAEAERDMERLRKEKGDLDQKAQQASSGGQYGGAEGTVVEAEEIEVEAGATEGQQGGRQ